MKLLLSLLAVPLLATAACTSDGGFSDQADSAEGIYRVDSHLLNEGSCSPGGTAFSGGDAFAFAKRGSAFGTDFLAIYSCASLADCRAKAALKQFEGTTSFSFLLTGADANGLTGFEATTGFSNGDGTCSMPEVSNLSVAIDADGLHLGKQTRIGGDYPAENGYCTTDKGRAVAEIAPCSEMETLDATLVEPL